MRVLRLIPGEPTITVDRPEETDEKMIGARPRPGRARIPASNGMYAPTRSLMVCRFLLPTPFPVPDEQESERRRQAPTRV